VKRIFDLFFACAGLLILLPFFIIISIILIIESKGGVFFLQKRVGKNNIDFAIFKFRTMYVHSEKAGLLTVGERDKRITPFGYKLRKYKLDELPQLINVLIGNMSFVGPRPEVRKYVDLYNSDQKKVLMVKPGITDLASLKYINENKILGEASNPEEMYINTVMPEKLSLNLIYLSKKNFFFDIKLIIKTVMKLFNK